MMFGCLAIQTKLITQEISPFTLMPSKVWKILALRQVGLVITLAKFFSFA